MSSYFSHFTIRIIVYFNDSFLPLIHALPNCYMFVYTSINIYNVEQPNPVKIFMLEDYKQSELLLLLVIIGISSNFFHTNFHIVMILINFEYPS